MSVMGGRFQRRLTKLYSDTKRSYESVTSLPPQQQCPPELVSLDRRFRSQNDRLITWGLDWSNFNGAQPHDIDESLDQAGLSDVVASIMSSIGETLAAADRVRNPLHPKAAEAFPGDSPAIISATPSRDSCQVPTSGEIAQMEELLRSLTSSIDALYDLSRNRRFISGGSKGVNVDEKKGYAEAQWLTSTAQGVTGTEARPEHKISFASRSPASLTSEKKEAEHHTPSHTLPKPVDESLYDFSMDDKMIDSSRVELFADVMDAFDPPPYEHTSSPSATRALGHLKMEDGSCVTVLVEFCQSSFSSMLRPQDFGSLKVLKAMESAVMSQNKQSSVYLGVLELLGCYLEREHERIGVIYRIPSQSAPIEQPGQTLTPPTATTLGSLFIHSNDDTWVPDLEIRFRLAYNLVYSYLNMAFAGLCLSNISSQNIMLFSQQQPSPPDSPRQLSTSDLRHPYLIPFDGRQRHPLPAHQQKLQDLYRHPSESRGKRNLRPAFDIYSLGLVLLEIGTWMPLRHFWKTKYDTKMFRTRIKTIYVKKLAPKCGNGYMKAVQHCLAAPDYASGNLRFDTVHYLSQALKQLGRSCLIEDIDIPSTPNPYENPLADAVAWYDSLRESAYSPRAAVHSETPPLAHKISGVDDDRMHLTRKPSVAEPKQHQMDASSRPKRLVKRWTDIAIPQQQLDEWNTTLMPRISRLLQKALNDSPESCSAGLMVSGETRQSAKPTVCVTCCNVQKVRSFLKQHFKIDKKCWDVLVMRGEVRRSKASGKKRRPRKDKSKTNVQKDLNPSFQQRPLCGASIGAFRNMEHLPPVTYGGAVLVDGEPYGMTVHHMLDLPSDEGESDEEFEDVPNRSMGNEIDETLTEDEVREFSWCEADSAEPYSFEVSDDDEDYAEDYAETEDGTPATSWQSEEQESDIEADTDDEDASVGDILGIQPDSADQPTITQPAIDDVHDDFFPCIEDRDNEHLSSHRLGYVHSSSGIRRWNRKGIKHEVDWALIKINNDRLHPANFLPVPPSASLTSSRGKSTTQTPTTPSPLHLTSITPTHLLPNLPVHCAGRTSGLQAGRISPALSLVKLHGRRSFSHSWCVYENARLGMPGDSGAWVFDASTGRIAGHVLAWSQKAGTAYIAPMEVLFEDMERTLGARVTLPGGEGVEQGTGKGALMPRINDASPDYFSPSNDQPVYGAKFPFDLSRLEISSQQGESSSSSSPVQRSRAQPQQSSSNTVPSSSSSWRSWTKCRRDHIPKALGMEV